MDHTKTKPEEIVEEKTDVPEEAGTESARQDIAEETVEPETPADEVVESEALDTPDTLGTPSALPEPVTPDEETMRENIEEAAAEGAAKVEKAEESNDPASADSEDKKSDAPTTPVADDGSRWFIIHTYVGHENKVAKTLKQRVDTMGYQDKVFDIIVPTRNTIKVSGGKKESIKEKIFPGYILVRMILTDDSWLLVRTTPGVTGFIGAGNKPTPISEKEVDAIKKFMDMEEPLYKASFTIGEAVKITDGPFADFLGTVDNIDETKGKIEVLVSIFGRETPVELDFLQVSKL